jgi:hypothetical protein
MRFPSNGFANAPRHCEERSDEAIQRHRSIWQRNWIASLRSQ